MIATRTELRDVEVIAEIRCDMCNHEIVNKGCGYEYANLTADWGYDSSHDMERIRWNLCEHCVYQRILPLMHADAVARMEKMD